MKEKELQELYLNRDLYYSRLFARFLAIPLSALFFILVILMVGYEATIWFAGERIQVPIASLEKLGSDEYELVIIPNGKRIKKELTRNQFKYLEKKTHVRIIYWKRKPNMSIFLDLNLRRDFVGLICSILLSAYFLFISIKRFKEIKAENPEKLN